MYNNLLNHGNFSERGLSALSAKVTLGWAHTRSHDWVITQEQRWRYEWVANYRIMTPSFSWVIVCRVSSWAFIVERATLSQIYGLLVVTSSSSHAGGTLLRMDCLLEAKVEMSRPFLFPLYHLFSGKVGRQGCSGKQLNNDVYYKEWLQKLWRIVSIHHF